MIDLLLDPVSFLAAADVTAPSAWWRFFGRLHPLLVHFPIAMILAAAVVELVLCWRKSVRPNTIASFCLWVGATFAALAAWTGWEMADIEGIAGNPVKADLLGWHRWTGIVLASLAAALCLAWLIERAMNRRWSFHVYRYGLWAAGILVCFVGYFGAEMKWGRDYLFSVLRSPDPTPALAGDAAAKDNGDSAESTPVASVSWATDVEPILAERCGECHGPDKQKGKLQLVPYAAFASHRKVIDTADPVTSVLVHRIMLPGDDPDCMPPEGSRLTSAQIKTIETWIGEGGVGPTTPSPVDTAAETSTGVPTHRTDPASLTPSPFDAAKQQMAIEAIDKLGGHVSPVSENSPWLDVSLSLVRPPATDGQVEILLGLRKTVIWLNLGATGITDAALEQTVSKLTSLHRLRMDRTSIGDQGLAALESLQALEVLNLFGTKVTDEGLATIEVLSSLRTVYLWNTGVTEAGMEALRAARPQLEVVGGPEAAAAVPAEAANENVSGADEPAPPADAGTDATPAKADD